MFLFNQSEADPTVVVVDTRRCIEPLTDEIGPFYNADRCCAMPSITQWSDVEVRVGIDSAFQIDDGIVS